MAASVAFTVAWMSVCSAAPQSLSSALTLATKMSKAPSDASQALNCPRSVTSTLWPWIEARHGPADSSIALMPEGRRAQNATLQPSAARARTMAAPMPEEPPVTTAFRP